LCIQASSIVQPENAKKVVLDDVITIFDGKTFGELRGTYLLELHAITGTFYFQTIGTFLP
jgi:hypothetical protein